VADANNALIDPLNPHRRGLGVATDLREQPGGWDITFLALTAP